jgi:hypothetical protein
MDKTRISGDGAPGAAKKKRDLSPEEATPILDDFVPETERAAKRRCLPTYVEAYRRGEGGSGGGGGEEGGNVTGRGCAELEMMTKPDRIRDSGAETEREANKKRNSPGEEMEVHLPLCEPDDQAALRHARPEMRGVGGNFAPKLFS